MEKLNSQEIYKLYKGEGGDIPQAEERFNITTNGDVINAFMEIKDFRLDLSLRLMLEINTKMKAGGTNGRVDT